MDDFSIKIQTQIISIIIKTKVCVCVQLKDQQIMCLLGTYMSNFPFQFLLLIKFGGTGVNLYWSIEV